MGVLTVAECTDQYGNYLVPNKNNTTDVVTWTGAGDGVSWTDVDNWDTASQPTSDQTALFDSGTDAVTVDSESVGGIETTTGFTGSITTGAVAVLDVGYGGGKIEGGTINLGLNSTITSQVQFDIGIGASLLVGAGIGLVKNISASERYNQQKDKRYHSVIALDNDDGNGYTFAYTYKFYFSEVEIGSDGSSCLVSITDSNLSDPEDYSIYGLSFDQVLHKRHFFAIVEMDSTDAKPVEGDTYLYDNNIVFSGFNKTGWALSTNQGDMFTATYTGIEQLFDDVLITGRMSYMNTASIGNVTFDGYVDDMADLKHQTNSCVFNPNGEPNKTNSDIKYVMPYNPSEDPKVYDDTIITFNNSRLEEREFFTLKDVFLYIKRWYFDDIGNLSNLFIDGSTANPIELHTTFDRLPYMNARISLSENNIEAVYDEFETIEVKDFLLEGVGVYSAIQQIFALSRKFMISIKYDGAGVANLIVREKNTNDRPEGNIELPVSRSDEGEDIDDEKIYEDTTLYGTRELGRVGRVILEGAKVQLLTMITNYHSDQPSAYAVAPAKFSTYSKNGKVYGAPSGNITDFTEYMAFSTKKIDEEGNLYYDTSNIRCYEKAEIPLTASQLNEDSTQLIFKGLNNVPITRLVPQEDNSEKDMGVNTSQIVKDGTDLNPYYNDGTNKFINVLKASENEFTVIYSENTLVLKNTQKGKAGESPRLTEWAYNDDFSFIPYENTTIPFLSGYLGSLFCRCLIESDYRIKGIAEIDGFDPEIHETVMLRDEDIELWLSWKDAYYTDGYFKANADGFISGHAKSNISILENIQSTAEAVLNKYQTLQNSGSIPLKVVQPVFMVGDYCSEIEGGGRTVTFPATINTVVHNFEMNSTSISLGALS